MPLNWSKRLPASWAAEGAMVNGKGLAGSVSRNSAEGVLEHGSNAHVAMEIEAGRQGQNRQHQGAEQDGEWKAVIQCR